MNKTKTDYHTVVFWKRVIRNEESDHEIEFKDVGNLTFVRSSKKYYKQINQFGFIDPHIKTDEDVIRKYVFISGKSICLPLDMLLNNEDVIQIDNNYYFIAAYVMRDGEDCYYYDLTGTDDYYIFNFKEDIVKEVDICFDNR